MTQYLPIFYIISVLGFIYILLFGTSEFHRNGIVGKLNSFLTQKLWLILANGIRKLCPSFVSRCVDGICYFCFNKRNPLLMIFYYCLVGGGYVIFLIWGIHMIPGIFLGIHHKYIFHVFVWTVLTWFTHVCLSDPGHVTTDNFGTHVKKYHYDNILYNKRICTTCQIIRPARSKHCRICNRCVARFDHHCAWINSDVGSGNLWKFLIFLFSTAAVCNYCAYLCFYVMYGVIEDKKMLEIVIKMPDGTVQQLPYSYIVQYLAYYHGSIIGLGAFCGLISIVLYCFFLYHCYLVSRNTTTCETFKWDDLKQHITQREKLQQQQQKNQNSGKIKEPTNTGEGKEIGGKKIGGKEIGGKEIGGKEKRGKETRGKETRGKETRGKETRGKETRGKETGGKDETRGKDGVGTEGGDLLSGQILTRDHLINTYNQGVRNNFYEVFFYDRWKGTCDKNKKS